MVPQPPKRPRPSLPTSWASSQSAGRFLKEPRLLSGLLSADHASSLVTLKGAKSGSLTAPAQSLGLFAERSLMLLRLLNDKGWGAKKVGEGEKDLEVKDSQSEGVSEG